MPPRQETHSTLEEITIPTKNSQLGNIESKTIRGDRSWINSSYGSTSLHEYIAYSSHSRRYKKEQQIRYFDIFRSGGVKLRFSNREVTGSIPIKAKKALQIGLNSFQLKNFIATNKNASGVE
ncbi:hypothetical protein J6590_050608 [Homalodisca vitripennis]|nr:hypothetical protein J6590_050608 [Homalodisca vitripennis]